MKFNILFKFLIIILFIELTYSKKCYIKNKNNNKIKVKLIKNKKNANSKYNENSSLIDKHSTSILPSTTNKFLKYSSNNSITNESLPTSTEVNIDKYEIEGFSTEEDSLEEDSVEEFSSVHTSANEDLPTSTEIENENLSSVPTSANEDLPTSTEIENENLSSVPTSANEDLPTSTEIENENLSSVPTSANEDLPTSTEIENENLSSVPTSANEDLPTSTEIENENLSSVPTSANEDLPTSTEIENENLSSVPTSANEDLPTSTEIENENLSSVPTSTNEDLPTSTEIENENLSSVPTSANEDLPTSTEIENENLSSTTTSADEISETIIPIKQNICNDVVTINNSNFITVYFKETLMYNKCILSDFYFIKENSSITTIMYCGKIYLNNDVQKYNIKINRNKSIIFGPSILEIEKVYKVYMTNKGEKTLCMNNNRKNNLDYKIEDAEEYIQLNSKSESKITLINKIDEIFMKNCSNEVSFNAIPALISSLEDDLCIDEDHILKIKYLFNNKDENNNNNASTPTFTITPEATSSSVNNYCDKSNKDLKYSEIKNKTFNFEGYVLYNKNTCKLNLVSSGPSNYYTLNPYNQKVQVNGFIECIYFDDEGNKSTYTKKVRIESLNGARKFKIISDVNPYADYTFFESFKYTHTSTVSNNDAIKDFTKGKFSMYNYITYYYDEEMKEKIGSIRSTWNYNVFVGEDVWITC